jgi:hypothetical protein
LICDIDIEFFSRWDSEIGLILSQVSLDIDSISREIEPAVRMDIATIGSSIVPSIIRLFHTEIPPRDAIIPGAHYIPKMSISS